MKLMLEKNYSEEKDNLDNFSLESSAGMVLKCAIPSLVVMKGHVCLCVASRSNPKIKLVFQTLPQVEEIL